MYVYASAHDSVEEEGCAEDGGDEDADEDVVRGDADEGVVVHGGGGGASGDEVLLVYGCGAERFGYNGEDHGALVDGEFCAAQVVVGVAEHVVGFELAPLHFLQVKAPYDCHFGGVVVMIERGTIQSDACAVSVDGLAQQQLREAQATLEFERKSNPRFLEGSAKVNATRKETATSP
ncbi:hypothetical protein OPT61_g4708 [Boeremia exigua]|uniref:Uncharacterized protein n=1 Tax=Boeremia exigua TaxID=749465 RepID=A0ACC2ICZ8_9PLEO|nr:hypothetical protein OPT61_g4708 [Boeremia exigua]